MQRSDLGPSLLLHSPAIWHARPKALTVVVEDALCAHVSVDLGRIDKAGIVCEAETKDRGSDSFEGHEKDGAKHRSARGEVQKLRRAEREGRVSHGRGGALLGSLTMTRC